MTMFLKVRDPKSQAVSYSSIANTADMNSLLARWRMKSLIKIQRNCWDAIAVHY